MAVKKEEVINNLHYLKSAYAEDAIEYIEALSQIAEEMYITLIHEIGDVSPTLAYKNFIDNSESYDNLPSQKDSIMESIEFVVDMMNSGKVNARDVYPGGSNRYHGD